MTEPTRLLILIDPSSGVPVYRQLMDQIRFLIAGGIMRPGDPLPSTRSLSAELGVNPMTISKAYSFLERDGVVERRPGRPLVVRSFKPRQLHDQKLDRLRESLIPTVQTVRQLAIDRDDALQVFEEMLDGCAKGTGEEEPS
jgi:GntR family transcriptional regulator